MSKDHTFEQVRFRRWVFLKRKRECFEQEKCLRNDLLKGK